MNYLLDTCTISDFFKKIPFTVTQFEETSPDQLYISSITVMEIEYGLKLHIEREKKIRPIWDSLTQYLQILPFSPPCATASAILRAKLKNAGCLIGPYDILLAGTALAHNLIIVTSNLSEFHRVSEITIKNWRVQ